MQECLNMRQQPPKNKTTQKKRENKIKQQQPAQFIH